MDAKPSQAELAELMQKAKAGDRSAFDQVYRYFFAPVFRYALKRMASKNDAEDIAQSVFMKFYASKTEFKDQGIAPLAYLFTITRNLIVDHWQKNGKASVGSLPDEDVVADSKNYQREAETRVTVAQALELLEVEQRQIIQLRLLDGKETREVARLLGKTEMAVRQIQCRALKELRKRMTKVNPPPAPSAAAEGVRDPSPSQWRG